MNTTAMNICASCRHSYSDNALYCPNCGRPKLREAVVDPLVGKLLGDRFQVQELIGQGGSGTIYRAEHVTLRRKVAIKVLHTELSRDDLAVERMRREATTVAEIDNEHIVEIHDFGRTPDGRLYMAMELLEGETLDSVLAREHQLSVERTADILIQVGEALMEAHAIGYVHRDLRPRNVYLAVRRGKANFVKLLDFGLSKLVETDAQAASTSLGMTFGDPRYMSPEQARGDRIDRRADIYQLGCVAYEMLTGAPPFIGSRVFDILSKQVTDIPAPLPTRRPGVPLWMEAACAKMLAKDPENRFATTTRMVEALRRGLETGEVMEDEVARRRESIPPPSVSRVMQRMGLSAPTDYPQVFEPAPRDPGLPASAIAARPEPVEALPVEPVVPRRRTGTPQVGVPAVEQRPVTGLIDAPKPAGRAKRASSHGPGTDSEVWYQDGDRASEEDGAGAEVAPVRARKPISPSTTDLSLYDEPIARRRWPIVLGVLGVLGVGGSVVFALTRGGDGKPTKPAERPQPVVAAAPVDAAPSTIISAEIPDAAVAIAAIRVEPPVAVVKKDPPPVRVAPHDHPVRPNTGKVGDFDFGVDDSSRRHPEKPTPPVTIIAPTPPSNPSKLHPPGVSGVDGPLDPYAGGGTTDPGDAAAPDKKAEFYANLGEQQLLSGDTAGAAANFKKASELDPKNVAAVTGMGEIALRQGLFGDAIAHLKKAARMSPRSSHVFTLLGEAYLNSGQNAPAAENFKKALQLDPDNARARDGYGEASSRVPPPTDDN